MERQTVSVRRSPTYEREAMLEAVTAHFDAFGGVDAFVRPGDRVLIKTNLLMARAPQAATTTHPSLVWAIASVAKAAGGLVTCEFAARCREKGLSIEKTLADNDAYNLLRQTDGLIVTGPTGTNVCDLTMVLVK